LDISNNRIVLVLIFFILCTVTFSGCVESKQQEHVSMGPYDVSFDLGSVSHTTEVFPPSVGASSGHVIYYMEIHLPDNKDAEIWAAPGFGPDILQGEPERVVEELESNSVNWNWKNSTPVGKAHLIDRMVDGRPGIVGSINLTDGSTFSEAQYHLESGSRVSLFAYNPYSSTLVDTIHVTESGKTKGSSTPGWSVKVISSTSWSGSFGGDGNQKTIDGYGNKVIPISGDPQTWLLLSRKRPNLGR
jgi:hypothetical protein